MRKVAIRVVPNAKKERVVEAGEGLKVYVRAPAREGKANRAVREVLAGYFGVKRSQVKIVQGGRGRHKAVEIG